MSLRGGPGSPGLRTSEVIAERPYSVTVFINNAKISVWSFHICYHVLSLTRIPRDEYYYDNIFQNKKPDDHRLGDSHEVDATNRPEDSVFTPSSSPCSSLGSFASGVHGGGSSGLKPPLHRAAQR